MPLTEALVNVEATIRRLAARGLIDAALAEALEASARGLFFKRLTFEAVVERAGAPAGDARAHRRQSRRSEAGGRAGAGRASCRRMTTPCAAKPAWELARPSAWRRQLERLVEARRG